MQGSFSRNPAMLLYLKVCICIVCIYQSIFSTSVFRRFYVAVFICQVEKTSPSCNEKLQPILIKFGIEAELFNWRGNLVANTNRVHGTTGGPLSVYSVKT